jgi:hypothetical protein
MQAALSLAAGFIKMQAALSLIKDLNFFNLSQYHTIPPFPIFFVVHSLPLHFLTEMRFHSIVPASIHR